MKCNKCNKTWSLYDVKDNYDICPHCKQKISTKFDSFDSVAEGLHYCIKAGGKDILKNKSKMNSYISDLMGNSFNDRNLVKNAVESDIGAILYDADEKDNQEKQIAFNQAVARMEREFSTNHEKAREIVSYFTEALQWNINVSENENEKPKQQTEANSPGNAVIQGNPQNTSGNPVNSIGNAVIQGNPQNTGGNPVNSTGNAVIQGNPQNTGGNPANSTGNATIQGNMQNAGGNPVNTFNNTGNDNGYNRSGNAAIQGNMPNTGGNFGSNVNLPVNQNEYQTEVLQGSVITSTKKRSKLPMILVIIILLLIAAAIAYWFLIMKPAKEESVMVVPEPTTVETTEISTEDIDDSEMNVITTADPALLTEPTTTETTTETTAAETTVVTTEKATEASTEPPEEVKNEFSVTNLASLEWADHTILRYDNVNKRIYFWDGIYQVKYYDIATGNTELLVDMYTGSDLDSYRIEDFAVNPYNGNVYMVLYNVGCYFYDCTADKILCEIAGYSLGYDAITFISADEAVAGTYRISLSSGEILYTGKRPNYGENLPFLHDNNYYYFDIDNYNVYKTKQILTADNNYEKVHISERFVETVDTETIFFNSADALYYMNPDHSVYQLDVDSLFNKTEDDGGVIGNKENKTTDRLIVDGSKIENNGTAYLSSDISNFMRIDDSCIIVYDAMDKTIKMIGDFPQ